jgi:O-antigen/teichoic acid export membrane protein
VFADFVLAYWIGGEQGQIVAHESTATMRWLLAALMVQSLAAIPYIFCEALGRPEINNGFAVASAIIHIPLVLALVPQFGIAGAAIALFLNSATQTIAFILFSSRKLMNVSLGELFTGAIMRPLISALVASGVGFLTRPFVRDLFSLLVALILMALTYLGFAVATGAVNREDLGYLWRMVEWLPMWFPGRASILKRRHELETR